ncbi:MAG: glycosyltransferase family 4 protein [Sedimentisphaerales bacterium]|nr:glycosyltransferase family 4 protein [Sedimentisphaerales bacterium]
MVLENGIKKSLRLALIASEHTMSEYSMFLENLLVGLADESIPVALVCPPGNDVNSMFTGTAEIIQYPVFDVPLTEPLNRRLLIERLVKFRPTVLHCLCESMALLTRRLTRRLDLPYVLMVNTLATHLTRFSVSPKRCAKIIVPTKSVADDFAQAYPRISDRVEQINIGTFVLEDNGCFSDSSHFATIMMTQPLDDVDGIEKLFAAIRHLMLDEYEFMMIVTGNGRGEVQLRQLLAALGLLQIVTIVPRLKPWRSLLAAGDIFVQPQPDYTFNPLLLEAMSVGSVVATCKGGVDDLIIDGRTAVLFDPDDELSIVSTLQRLLNKRDFARSIAKTAQQYLKDNHSVSKMISATFEAYTQAHRRPKG